MAVALPIAADVLAELDPALVGKLMKLGPEEAERLRDAARRAGSKLKFEFGLDGDEEAMGWKLLALLGWEVWELYLKGPIETAWHIEQQVAGVLQQLYTWLGGAGKAVDAGIADVESLISTEEKWLASW